MPADYETRIIKCGDTTWISLRARGAEWSWLLPNEAAKLGAEWVKKYTPSAPEVPTKTLTLSTISDDAGPLWLCVEEANGALHKLARFESMDALKMYQDAVNQHWRVAHAMGLLGF